MSGAADWVVPKLGIVISPSRDVFRQSKEFIKHRHEHWDTIASDYHHLANYHTTTSQENVNRDNFSLTRSCFLSLQKEPDLVNENFKCLCGETDNDTLVQRFCPLPQELEIENILIPYHNTFDYKRKHDVVFHYWSRPYKRGCISNIEGYVPRFKSRVCVRSVTQDMLTVEKNCPYLDMRISAKYVTKARQLGMLHHVIVQDFVKSSSVQDCVQSSLRRSRRLTVLRRTLSRVISTRKDRSQTISKLRKVAREKTDSEHLSVEGKLVSEACKRRLKFGRIYNLYKRETDMNTGNDKWDDGYWRVEAKRLGDLPRWKSRYTTHIQMDFPGLPLLMQYDLGRNKQDTGQLSLIFEHIHATLKPFLFYNNSSVLPQSYRLCFNEIPVTDQNPAGPNEGSSTLSSSSNYFSSARLCTLRLPCLLPPILEESGSETYRRSVLYDHAMHMTITEEDTIWVGDVRFKPALSSYLDISMWKETPLAQIQLKPGVYKWAAFQLGMNTAYSDCSQVDKFTRECSDCLSLFTECENHSTIVSNDQTPHFYLINTIHTDRDHECRHDLFEFAHTVSGLNDFDRLVHIWACDKEEFSDCGINMPFNWWDKVDSHLKPLKMWWPVTKMRSPFTLNIPIVKDLNPNDSPYLKNEVELRHHLLSTTTKLVVKNPTVFFQRSLITVEMCSGGTKGGGYILMDANTLEVVGAILLDIRGSNRYIYDCHRHWTHRNQPRYDIQYGSCFHPLAGQNLDLDEQILKHETAVGIHFVPQSYQNLLQTYDSLSSHLTLTHSIKSKARNSKQQNINTEDCFSRGVSKYFTPHDFNIRPSDVVNATHPFETSRKIVEVTDSRLGRLEVCTNMKCDPYDQHWYGRLEGTPRHKLSDINH